MPTSIRDLAYQLQAEATLLAGRPHTSTEVRPALIYLGRALNRLAIYGLDEPDRASRRSVSDELADACLRLAPSADLAVESLGENRATRLAATLSDAVAIRSTTTGYEQRWAATAEIARTCRVLTTYGQGAVLSHDLDWVRRTARAVAVQALADPPVPVAGPLLDAPIPTRTLTRETTALAHAEEAAALLVDRLSRPRMSQHGPPSLGEVFAATRAAESALRYAVTISAVLAGQEVPRIHSAPAAWRAVRAELQPFTASAASNDVESDDVSAWCRLVHTGLRDTFGPPDRLETVAGRDVRHLQHIANLMPEIADALDRSVRDLADRGDLHALAHRLPHRDDRTPEFLGHTPVVADRDDVEPARRALIIAAGHTAEVAVELHCNAGGGDQPGLIDAHVARARTAFHHSLPPERRWRPLMDAVDARVATDPHWPALAAHLQSTHASGGNVRPARQPLPRRRPTPRPPSGARPRLPPEQQRAPTDDDHPSRDERSTSGCPRDRTPPGPGASAGASTLIKNSGTTDPPRKSQEHSGQLSSGGRKKCPLP